MNEKNGGSVDRSNNHAHMIKSGIKIIIYWTLYLTWFDRIVDFALETRTRIKLHRYRNKGLNVNFVPQGGYELMISGDRTKFSIHSTSHLKSDTFIECSGGVEIGRYFHVGRGLTIFSVAHDYKRSMKLPYDEEVISLPVIIGDFVWCGANVTILPGVTVGEGAILGAGTVITRDVAALTIVAGNPAKVIGKRDELHFEKLRNDGLFF